MINEHGGKMPNAIGVPEEQLRQAARSCPSARSTSTPTCVWP